MPRELVPDNAPLLDATPNRHHRAIPSWDVSSVGNLGPEIEVGPIVAGMDQVAAVLPLRLERFGRRGQVLRPLSDSVERARILTRLSPDPASPEAFKPRDPGCVGTCEKPFRVKPTDLRYELFGLHLGPQISTGPYLDPGKSPRYGDSAPLRWGCATAPGARWVEWQRCLHGRRASGRTHDSMSRRQEDSRGLCPASASRVHMLP